MAKITVDSYQLEKVISLVKVYMGLEKEEGHFKDPGQKLVDTSYHVALNKLEESLKRQTAQGNK